MGGISPPDLPALFVLLFSLMIAGSSTVELPAGISDAASSMAATAVRCSASEREALVEFKRRLIDPSRRLSSWVGEDCCAWEGVGCSNATGRVLKLDLRNRHRRDLDEECPNFVCDGPYVDYNINKWKLQGEISESLLSLQHLRHLDLSANDFLGKHIPDFLGSLTRLTYLNLSGGGFAGRIPHQLGNLSRLVHLDLSNEDEEYDLHLKDAGWISRLTSLRHLKMNQISLASDSNWLEALNSLPRIQVLEMSDCELENIPGSLPHVNFTSLTALDLSANFFIINSTVPEWLFNITTLVHLNLGWSEFNWPGVPISIAKLSSLQSLDLSGNIFQYGTTTAKALSDLCNLQTLMLYGVNLNDELINLQNIFSNSCLVFTLEELDLTQTHLSGILPDWLGNMRKLKRLHLPSNRLYGSFPASLKNLSLLRYLDVNGNGFNGTIEKGMSEHMKELIYLDISGNSLSLAHFANLSSLQYFRASYIDTLNGKHFKDMLRHMNSLVELDLTYNSMILSEENLSDLSSLKNLYISSNTLILNESFEEDWIPPFQLKTLSMGSCKILPKPQIPKWIQTQRALTELDLSSDGIQGTIPNWLPTTLRYLFLSNNQFTGHLPYYLRNIVTLELSNNFLSGQIFSKMAKIMPNISRLDLSMNNLSGTIPLSFCHLKFLKEFRISKNKLWRSELPNCWKNSSNLEIIDFSNNKFHGEIPRSLCNLQLLAVLHLSGNDLSGPILDCLKHCTRLLILDLSHNHFSGNVPTWIGESLDKLEILDLRSNALMGSIPLQLSNLANLQILDLSNNNFSGIIPPSFGNLTKFRYNDGQTIADYSMLLFFKGNENEYNLYVFVCFIDLSNNRLIGHIPKELGELHELQGLNLSMNYLTGEIPSSFKKLQNLEVLDLSRNNLSGRILSDLASLTFLNRLNVSYNNLSGEVPTGTQLQTFDSSSYIGNPNLCGFPLSKKCTNNTKKVEGEKQGEGGDYKIEIIYLCLSIALGFITGFWAICGTLLLRRRWRFAYFQYIDSIYDKIYVVVTVTLTSFKSRE